MKVRRIRAIARKEVLQIIRDPFSLVMALLMPFLQMALLGYGMSLDVKHLPVCVFDREGSQTSQALLKRFQASIYFQIAGVLASYDAVKDAIDRGTCTMALVVPNDFSQRLAETGMGSVQAILDGTDENIATLAMGYAQAVVSGFQRDVALRWDARHTPNARPAGSVAVQSRVWFNEDLDSRNFIIPGAVALIMALIGAQLTSLTIAREWERGTMELLVSTPVTPMELMFGKLAPYFVIGLTDAAFCLAIAALWFGVPFRGTVFALFIATSLFLLVILGIGYLISVGIRNQIGASQIALLVTMLPTTILSGMSFPIDQMPAAIQGLSYAIFARYYVTILKAVFLKGSGLPELAVPLAALGVWACVIAALAARAFRKTID
ncbi:MAG TPA: ABC transporter permease [Stellaceae bacterium]|nr:ABC transporter permease [Stellaceae bacterium]